MKSGVLLIGGSPRSGTTAVLQMLNSNPNVYISSEENLFKVLHELEKLLDTRGKRAKPLEKGMRALSPRETLTMENIHSHNFDRKAVWPTLRFIYEYHHQLLHPNVSLMLWGDKLPNYAREIERVLALPGVHYLHITRNPIDVVNSMMRRLDAAKKGMDWWKTLTEFDEMIEAWASAYEAIQSVEGKKNILHLHYEELVFDTKRNTDTLNKFIGLDLNYQNMLVSDKNLHYDRTFINQEMIAKMTNHTIIKEYINKFKGNGEFKNVANSLSSLL